MDKLHTASDCIVHARSTRQPFCLCVGHERAAAWAPRVLQWRRARMRGTAARKEPRRQRVRLPRITRTAVAPAHARAPGRAAPGACARLLRRLRSQLLPKAQRPQRSSRANLRPGSKAVACAGARPALRLPCAEPASGRGGAPHALGEFWRGHHAHGRAELCAHQAAHAGQLAAACAAFTGVTTCLT